MRFSQGLSWAVLAQLLFLALTGTYLSLWYRPTPAGTVDREVVVRWLHRIDAWVVTLTALALVVCLVAEHLRSPRPRARRRALLVAGSLPVPLGCMFATFTGWLLPWDQLALWAVTVGSNMSGYRPLLDAERVRFVMIGGREVSRSSVAAWFWIHAAVGVVLVVATAVLLVVRPPTGVPTSRDGAAA